jgi:hypothetical protein
MFHADSTRGRTARRRMAGSLAAAPVAAAAAVALTLAGVAVPAASAAPGPAARQPGLRASAGSGAWAVQPTPNPLTPHGQMSAVSCVSPSTCIAVGSRLNPAGTDVTLAEAWNGSSWSVLKTPNPVGVRSSMLSGVACTSASFCIAVGSAFSSAGGEVPFAEVWDGRSWSVQQTPVPALGGFFTGVSCASATACVAVGGYFTARSQQPLAEVWNGTAWSIHNPAARPSTGEFSAVSCLSAGACTAVGNQSSGEDTLTLAEAWNGNSWSVQHTPNIPGSNLSTLSAVSCTSATFCIAVGPARNPVFSYVPLAERWDGTSWSIQTTPSVRGLTTVLESVSCTSATACTATGHYFPSGDSAPAAERWNGTAWSVQRVPAAPQIHTFAALLGVSCASASRCTAVGYNVAALAAAWNGTAWSYQPIRTPPGNATAQLSAVSCASATACMAVGNHPTAVQQFVPFAEEWNGTSWSLRKTPVSPTALPFGAGTVLHGVSCTAPDACTAVGSYITRVGGLSTLAERWNGTSWSIQPTPDQPGGDGSSLLGVSCTSAGACTAVGYYYNPGSNTTSTLAEAWNGTSWAIQPTPRHATTVFQDLDAVSCTSPTACIAVGSVGYDTLAEMWNGTAWALQRTPHPGRGAEGLLGVSCTSASGCTAVGFTGTGTLAERWNGTSWSIQPTPGPATLVPRLAAGVSCTSASRCTAVWSTRNRTTAANWSGTSWVRQPTARPRHSLRHTLGSVSCVPTGRCTAVGSYQAPSPFGPAGGTVFTLAEARP